MPQIKIEQVIRCKPAQVFSALGQFDEWPFLAPETFPEPPQRLGERLLRVRMRATGRDRSFTALLAASTGDSCQWTAAEGGPVSGEVRLQSLGANSTQLTLRLDYKAGTVVETFFALIGQARRRINSDLCRFKQVLEARWGTSMIALPTVMNILAC